ncbi:hypothetical protein ANN_26819 [Periplaneta americana]|uniref:DUF659 domain-containing protein n=1 Tax=Periplaneta americana TaxID=6978 RepID=A0ABQ8RZN6_PERAM|nr:hypothetical protein ANN_26819 [Periplaneta americana]
MQQSSNGRNEFFHDMCSAMVAENIPWYKLQVPKSRAFLEKYCRRQISNDSTLRKNYLHLCYKEALAYVRRYIGSNYIWIAVNETTDIKGCYVVNLVIGKLDGEISPTPFLISSKVLEHTNHATVARFVNDGLKVLWPEGIQEDKVLVLYSDAAAYMLKAGTALRVFYQNKVHFTCLAHGLQRVTEEVRRKSAVSVRETQSAFSDSKVQCQLAYIQSNFGFIADSIIKLETRGMPLKTSLDIVEDVKSKLSAVEGIVGIGVMKKFVSVMGRDPSFSTLTTVCKILSGKKRILQTTSLLKNFIYLNLHQQRPVIRHCHIGNSEESAIEVTHLAIQRFNEIGLKYVNSTKCSGISIVKGKLNPTLLTIEASERSEGGNVSPRPSTENCPAFALNELRETSRKKLNQVICSNQSLNLDQLVSWSDMLSITPQQWTSRDLERSVDAASVRHWFQEKTSTTISSAPPRFPFKAASPLNFNIVSDNDNSQFFKLFFDNDLINIIFEETIRHANKYLQNAENNSWQPTTDSEIRERHVTWNEDDKAEEGRNCGLPEGKNITTTLKDKKDVVLLSTIHSAEMVIIKDNLKPKMVLDYNNSMGGADKSALATSACMPRQALSVNGHSYNNVNFHSRWQALAGACLQALETSVVRERTLSKAKRDEVTGEWRKLHNTELHALYSSPGIIRNIKFRRLRWAGHVARMGESRNAYRVLVGRPEGKRPLGRPRHRWEDNITLHLREVGYDDREWINFAQDREKWRVYVRAAMNLRVP